MLLLETHWRHNGLESKEGDRSQQKLDIQTWMYTLDVTYALTH